jgi:hypothetical protein
MGIFIGNFENKEDVIQEFSEGYDEPDLSVQQEIKNCNILFAWYGYGDYDGSTFVLFARDGKLYEVNGGHCSCYGLEGQWDPEETSVEALRHRIHNGSLGQDTYSDEGVFGEQLLTVLENWRLVDFLNQDGEFARPLMNLPG